MSANQPMKINERLSDIQMKLKVPKGNFNSFGKYAYRSCEDILESIKPLLGTATLTLSDEMVIVGDRVYVKATATIRDDGEVSVTAFAREPISRKGMDESQITGTASSYARKYALNGLFCIDDTKDADTMDNSNAHALDDSVIKSIKAAETLDDLKSVWVNECKSDSRYTNLINERKGEL